MSPFRSKGHQLTSALTDDRDVHPFPARPTTGLRYRVETLIGITGIKMQKYRCSWWESVTSIFDLVWRPHALLMLVCEWSSPYQGELSRDSRCTLQMSE